VTEVRKESLPSNAGPSRIPWCALDDEAADDTVELGQISAMSAIGASISGLAR